MQFNYTPLSGKRMFINFDGEITNSPEDLKLKTQKFREEYEAFRMDEPTFSEKASELMKKRKWNSSIFKDKTLLSDSIYSLIINEKEIKPWGFRTALAVCVGLELTLETTKDLLARAGHAFGTSEKHQIYSFLFTDFRGQSIDECNDFLLEMKLPPLGSNERNIKN